MLSLLFFTTAGFSEVSDTLVTGGYDKQAMSDAIKHARKETDKFIEVMNKKDADTFAVKAPITDHGRTEHFWLTDVTYSNGMFIGVISNDPREGANKQVISSQADSLIKISRIWADFFPANTSNQPI